MNDQNKNGIDEENTVENASSNNGSSVADNSIEEMKRKNKKTKMIIIIVFAASLLLLLASAIVPQFFAEEEEDNYKEYPPIEPSKLYETKEEDFDIMEYDEYLNRDRNIYFLEGSRDSYTKTSVTEKEASKLGEDVLFIYELLNAVIDGDVDTYNDMVAEELEKESFTQQQLYDIKISRSRPNEGEDYDYVLRVEYKIHENNGTYRNNILPDATRYQLFCLKSVGKKLVAAAIIEPYYESYEKAEKSSCSSFIGGGSVMTCALLTSAFLIFKKKRVE